MAIMILLEIQMAIYAMNLSYIALTSLVLCAQWPLSIPDSGESYSSAGCETQVDCVQMGNLVTDCSGGKS